MTRFISILCAIGILWSCKEHKPANRFSDPVLVSIAELQDRRLSDSLSQFFKSENPTYRAAAALAFASVQDTSASPRLGNLLLEDQVALVRSAAAFALGQTGGNAAVNALIPAILDKDHNVARDAVEALGKTVRKDDLSHLLEYVPVDSAGQEGLSWAFYRLLLRGIADSVIAKRESEFLNKRYTQQTRLAAAHFFGRSKLSAKAFEQEIIEAALNDPSPDVRMAVTGGLKKLDATRAKEVLKKIARNDKDYRVRNNAVRACSNFSLKESQEIVFGALVDSSVAVQISASEVILKGAKENPFKRLADDIRGSRNFRVKANLYGALLSSSTDDRVVKEIMDLYKRSDTYGKAWLLMALSYSQNISELPAFEFLSMAMIKSRIPVIKSNAALSLVAMNYHTAFFKNNNSKFIESYKQGIEDGDAAVMGIVAGALVDSTLGYRDFIHDLSFLYKAKMKLQLPRDIESLQPLEDAIAYLEGKPKPAPLKNAFNHPLNWNLIKSIPDNQRVLVKTTSGEIVMRLFVDETPGSVANVVDLISKKYFDGKFFHRVVPNFVIQTGCNRGDGFGSEDYSIRSEFSRRRYRTGSVGMASAGKDTEGTQWFITHCPTPHLDGRYTLFAEVEKGQAFVDRIEVGDSIIAVSLIRN